MESERKREIEKKRERLLQLKQAKLMRSETISSKEVEELVNSLIGPPGNEWKNSLRDTSAQAIPAEEPKPTIAKELSIESIGVFDFLPEERVMYSKEMQTDDIPVAAEAKEVTSEKIVSDNFVQEDVAAPVAELTETEKLNLLNSGDFNEFFERSSKMMERALEEEYDYLIDYTQGITQQKNTSEIQLYKQFQHDRWTRNRQITDLDWSTLFPELCLASYNKNPTNINESDGLVLVWNLHLSERPEFVLHAQEIIEITLSQDRNLADDVSVTCHAFQNSETSILYVGSEKGRIYQVNRFERAGIKAGIDFNMLYDDHSSCVTALDTHPSKHPDFQNLMLSSSFDWTVKLWNTQQYKTSSAAIKPIKSFEESRDFITDVKWCPTSPSVFASVDGSGNLDLYNLITSEIPISTISAQNGHGFNRLSWDKLGSKIACGSLDGSMQIYEVGHVL
ncbi:hypothetical protein HDV01_006801 [Terramyces sp. JEL0728]|nr:hypothetical protein HDV01_006801 [Terramyces sp. JEL0728]